MTALTLTPAQIVAELDRYIVGQEKAKRAVAIALRNRWRRQNVPPELRDEVAPQGWGRPRWPGDWRSWRRRRS